MVVRGGTLTTQGIWDDTDIVHVVQDQTIYVPDFHTYGGLRLESSATASLVIKLLRRQRRFYGHRPAAGHHRSHRRGAAGPRPARFPGRADVPERRQRRRRLPARRDCRKPTPTTTAIRRTAEVPLLPTVPDVPNGLRIDNNVATNVVGHFEYEPQAGGGASIITWIPPGCRGRPGRSDPMASRPRATRSCSSTTASFSITSTTST